MKITRRQGGLRFDFREMLACVLAVTLASFVGAGTLVYVDADSRGGDGFSWKQALPSLESALAMASVPGSGVTQIWVATGTYRPTQQTDAGDPRSATFTLVSGVELYGHFVGTERTLDERDLSNPAGTTVLSGDLAANDGPNFSGNEENAYTVVTATNVGPPGLRLDGFRITAGHANGPLGSQKAGGGLRAVDTDDLGELHIAHCHITANEADGAAGALVVRGQPVFNRCDFVGNAANNTGGGLNVRSAAPTLSHCAFVDNWAGGSGTGGGVAISELQASIEVVSCTFEGNTSSRQGGGLFISFPLLSNIHATVKDCNFTGNTAGLIPSNDGQGAGLFIEDVELDLIDCKFAANIANRDGGGVYVDTTAFFPGPPGSFVNCDFRGNVAGINGGGAYIHSSKAHRYENCLFTGNSCAGSGGGLCLGITGGSTRHVINCTFTGNAAGEDGGGLFTPFTANLVTGCIFWDNSDVTGAGESGQLYVTTPVEQVNYSCILGWTGSLGGVGNHGLTPLFINAMGPDRTYGTDDDNPRLLTGSPCIDAASNGAISRGVTEDLDGNPRFQDDPATIDTGLGRAPIVDMGAYEFQPSLDPADLDQDGDVDGFDLALLLGQWTGAATYAPCPPTKPADLNSDCKINGFDLAVLLGAWTGTG